MKVAVIEAREGKVIETRVVEGDFFEIVKNVSKEAVEKWSPSESDFVAVKDTWEIKLDETVPDTLKGKFRDYGLVFKSEEGEEVAKIPVYTISYDNIMVSEDNYKERGLYIIVPYIDEDLKLIFESEAAELTSEKTPPPGLGSN